MWWYVHFKTFLYHIDVTLFVNVCFCYPPVITEITNTITKNCLVKDSKCV